MTLDYSPEADLAAWEALGGHTPPPRPRGKPPTIPAWLLTARNRQAPRGGYDELKIILRQVAARHHLMPSDLIGRARTRNITRPRQEFMAVAWATGRFGQIKIGKFLGGRDHTTVCTGIKAHLKRAEAKKTALTVG